MENLTVSTAEMPKIREVAEEVRDLVLANLALIGETPAPTFAEDPRGQVLLERFAAAGVQNTSMDRLGNVAGMIPGTDGRQTLLVTSNLDTIVEDLLDQTIELQSDRVIGPFVGDNSLALAALSVLPTLLERLQLNFKSNLVLLGSVRALKRGNVEGLRSFLAESGLSISGGITLESVQLGRLNYTCMGMLRGEITCRLPETFDWARYGAAGTIMPMSDVIQRIGRIPVPGRPTSSVILGQIEGGITFNNIARETRLRFEVRSESKEIIRQIREQIEDIAEDVAGQSGLKVTFDVVSEREPGGIDISHPMVRHARTVIGSLGLVPQLYATTTVLSALRDAKIPAITIGMAVGERKDELAEIDESISLASIPVGLAQLVGILLAIDGGQV